MKEPKIIRDGIYVRQTHSFITAQTTPHSVLNCGSDCCHCALPYSGTNIVFDWLVFFFPTYIVRMI